MDAPSMVQRSGDNFIIRRVISGDQLVLDQKGSIIDNPSSTLSASEIQARTNILSQHLVNFDKKISGYININNNLLKNDYAIGLGVGIGVNAGGGVGGTGSGSGGGGGGNNGNGERSTSPMNSSAITATAISGATGNEAATDSDLLPQCKIKRNYSCNNCTYYTQNPRKYLTHLRDIHGEKIVINECKHCLYASRHYQKLVRHMKMVHGSTEGINEPNHSRKRSSQNMNSTKKRKIGTQNLNNMLQSGSNNNNNNNNHNNNNSLNNNNIIINNNNSNNNNIHHSNNNNNKNNETSLENLDYLHAMDLHQLQQLQQHRQQQQQQHHQQLQQQHHHQQQLPAVCNDKTNNNNNTINNNKMLKCTVCEYTTPFRDHLLNHEKDEHVKTKFFRCLKCSYVTHIKARYSKHVKYHSMPMIKCMLCDFQTPYKWNLDRHSKNHGGSGGFKCSLCNFTADIKQSLTVHEMNHHVPVSGTGAGMGMTGTGMGTGAGSIWQGGGILGGGRRKNKVGGTDLIDFDDDYPIPNMHDFHDFHDMYEHEFKTEETDDMDDDHNGDGGDRDDDDDEAPMNLKVVPKLEPSYSPSKKPSRPVPNLIPIQNNVQMLSNMQIMKNLYAFEQKLIQHHSPNGEKSSNSSLKDYSTMYNNDGYVTNDDSDSNGTPPEASPAHSSSFSIFKKKNYTFFDKLKEKLITSSGDDENLTCQCGYMAKSLSDSILHQKNCGKKSEHMNASSGSSKSSLGSTRCKYCRHRCKSSADLLIHLENCYEKSVADEPMHTPEYLSDEAVVDDPNVAVPHPLENVVFVWNKFENENKSPSNAMKDIQMQQEDSNTSSDMARNDNTYYGIETAPGYGEVTKQISPEETKNSATMKKVFKCPHCSFWASTASRFHVHIVGHLNKKPFECSLCSYRSNWRWDITKHIRLKTIRDPSHKNAQVLMNDETGRRNYTKYNKYISLMKVSDDIDFMRNSKINALGLSDSVVQTQSQLLDSLNNLDEISVIASYNEAIQNLTSANASDSLRAGGNSEDNNDNKKTHFKCRKCNFKDSDRHNVLNHVKEHYREAGLISEDNNSPSISNNHSRSSPAAGSAAGYSNYEDRLNHHDLSLLKNSSSSASATTTQQSQHLQIVESNILQSPLSTTQNSSSSSVNLTNLNGEMDEANSKGISGLTGWRGSAFRCAHCHQESNWKHVIQRHCRLKHNGNIAIEIIGSGSDSHKHNNESKRTATTTITTSTPINNNNNHSEKKTIKYDGVNINYNSKDIVNNSINISNNNINIHNNINMDHNISNINNSKNHNLSVSQNDAVMSANTDDFNDDGSKKESHEFAAGTSLSPPPMIMMGKTKTKRYKCHNCPYVTDSKSQFLYHKSFHKPRGEPFQCSYCSYNVTKRHLLNQHVKMHIAEKSKNETAESIKKSNEIEAIDLTTASTSSAAKRHDAGDSQQIMEINNVERQIYFCNLCPARYLSLKEIKVHQNFHNEENGNKCGACTYSTANDSYLNEHKIVHTTYYQEKTKEFLIKYKTNVDYEQPELKEVNDLKFTSEPYWIVPYKIGDLDDMIVSSVVPNINNNNNNNNNINNHNNNVNISSNLKKSNVNSNANTNNSSTDDEREKEKEKEIEKEKDKKKDGDSTTDKERNDNKIHTRQYLKINPIHQLRKSKRTQNAETNESKLQSKHVIYEKNDEDEDIVKCRFCPFSTSSTSIMKEHLLHHFSVSGLEDSYKCIHCDFSIDDSIKLHEHCKFHFVAITNPCKVSFYTNFDNIKIGYYPSEQPTDDAVSEADDEDNLDLNQITVTDKPNEKFEIVYDSDKMYTRLNEENGSNDEKIIINI